MVNGQSANRRRRTAALGFRLNRFLALPHTYVGPNSCHMLILVLARKERRFALFVAKGRTCASSGQPGRRNHAPGAAQPVGLVSPELSSLGAGGLKAGTVADHVASSSPGRPCPGPRKQRMGRCPIRRSESWRRELKPSASATWAMVRTAGFEPALSLRSRFSYHFGFRRRPTQAFVVWTIPSPCPFRGLGAARLVSTPSRPRPGLARDRQGFAPQLSPNLSGSTPGVSTRALL